MPSQSILPNSSSVTRAVGWNLAARAAELKLSPGSAIDIAYRIRENTDPEFGGLEVEVVEMEIGALQVPKDSVAFVLEGYGF